MLDTKAYSEWLGLQIDAALLQHAQGVARAVSGRQHDVASAQRVAVLKYHAFELAIFYEQIGHLALEAYFTTQRNDLLAHGRYDTRETKRADVRLADVENLGRCAGTHELVQYLASVKLWILDLTVEFAVGEQ